MGFFDDILADDMIHGFTDTFGETVVYTKKNGTTRTIIAVVDRFPPQLGPAGMTAPSFFITVANDATKGISTAEVDYGGDTVTVAQRIGGAATVHHLRRPADGQTDQDHGMLKVELT